MIPGILAAILPVVDDLFTTEEERAAAKLKLLQLEQEGKLAQLQVNANEARHKSIFVAGWRPFVGWICAFALAFVAIIVPFIHTVGFYAGIDTSSAPEIDTTITMQVLLGMLGLAAARSYEKKNGVS